MKANDKETISSKSMQYQMNILVLNDNTPSKHNSHKELEELRSANPVIKLGNENVNDSLIGRRKNIAKDKVANHSNDLESERGLLRKETYKAPAPKPTLIDKLKKKMAVINSYIDKFLDSNIVVIIMSLVTIFVLFAGDIKGICVPRSGDFYFNLFNLISFIFFIIELILSSVAKTGYLNSFFFWLDLVATVSLIMEIDWIFLPMIGQGSEGAVK